MNINRTFSFTYNGEPFTKGQLANAYRVSYRTFFRWMKKLGVGQNKQQYLVPEDIWTILKEKGNPHWGVIIKH